jgi:hypothetical protein
MIDYLEQLERDLVEAIDRREAGAAAPRRPRRRRPRLRPIVAVLAAALLLGTVVLVVARRASEQDKDIAVRPKPTMTPGGTPHPPTRGFKLIGDLKRVGADAWQGQADGPGGPATLTIIGTVDLSRERCCGSPERPGSFTKHVIRFTWVTPLGELEGCINNAIFRRPRGRWVWDGVGRVRRATGGLSRYRGFGAAIAGRTPTTSLGTAHIGIAVGTDPPPQRC